MLIKTEQYLKGKFLHSAVSKTQDGSRPTLLTGRLIQSDIIIHFPMKHLATLQLM